MTFQYFFCKTRLTRGGNGPHIDSGGLSYDSVLLDPLLSWPLSDFSVSIGFIDWLLLRRARGNALYKNRKENTLTLIKAD
jgi:hypothetical protein